MRRGYADTGYGQVHYYEAGRGDTVLLLHQMPVAAAMYSKVIADLARDHRVIAPDLPGCGSSDPLPDGFDVIPAATAMVELCHTLGTGKVKAFGVHTGAIVAAEMARQAPDLVESAVIVGFTFPLEERAERLQTIEEMERGLPGPMPIVVPSGDGSHLAKRWHTAYKRVLMGRERTAQADLDDDEMEFANMMVVHALISWRTGSQGLRAAFSYDAEARLPGITSPVLVMHVDSPYEGAHAKRSDRVAALIRNSRVEAVVGSDAFFTHWHPAEICGQLRDYWASLRPGA